MKKLNCTAPKLYGLRKTHKNNISYRPVVSCINCPSYEISVFIHTILSKFTNNYSYNVKNSYEMVNIIKNIILPKDYVLISLDVISLFPSIPKQLVIKILNEQWNFIKCYTSVSKEFFIELLIFIFETSYFQFQGNNYIQLDGTAMVNSARPTIANLVRSFLIDNVIKELKYNIPICNLYVDDMILAVHKDKVSETLVAFNNFNNNIKFTMEVQNNNKQIPFLDLLLIRNDDGSIDTNWYNKPSNSGRLLNYFSNHPLHQKINIIMNLLKKNLNLSSSKFHSDNLSKIKLILYNNSYPKFLVKKLINNFLEKNVSINTVNNISNNIVNLKFFKFPYIPGLSHSINNIIKKENQFKLVFYNIKTVNKLFTKIKDKVPYNYNSNLIYKINCKDCDLGYIEQTKQYLHKRVYQHKYDCKLTNINKTDKTALASHHFELQHYFDFDNVEILDKEHNYFKRNLSEMIQICINKDKCVNFRTDTENLSSLYKGIIDKYKSQ